MSIIVSLASFPPYMDEILTDSWGSVHTTPEKFENAALFLRLSLPFLLIRNENEDFKNALQTGGIWKRRLCVFVCTDNMLKTELYGNHDITIIMWFHSLTVDKHKLKINGDCCVFKFLRRSVDGKQVWCVFRVKPLFSNSSGVLWTGSEKPHKHLTDNWWLYLSRVTIVVWYYLVC